MNIDIDSLINILRPLFLDSRLSTTILAMLINTQNTHQMPAAKGSNKLGTPWQAKRQIGGEGDAKTLAGCGSGPCRVRDRWQLEDGTVGGMAGQRCRQWSIEVD